MANSTFYYVVSEHCHADAATWDKAFKTGNTLQDRANAIQFYNKRLAYLLSIAGNYSLRMYLCCTDSETDVWQISGVSAEHDDDMQDIEYKLLQINNYGNIKHIAALLHGNSIVI